jgi:hypothetical protein
MSITFDGYGLFDPSILLRTTGVDEIIVPYDYAILI